MWPRSGALWPKVVTAMALRRLLRNGHWVACGRRLPFAFGGRRSGAARSRLTSNFDLADADLATGQSCPSRPLGVALAHTTQAAGVCRNRPWGRPSNVSGPYQTEHNVRGGGQDAILQAAGSGHPISPVVDMMAKSLATILVLVASQIAPHSRSANSVRTDEQSSCCCCKASMCACGCKERSDPAGSTAGRVGNCVCGRDTAPPPEQRISSIQPARECDGVAAVMHDALTRPAHGSPQSNVHGKSLPSTLAALTTVILLV